jgi:phosphodiesterase/alkaline phosphatase D-like protein
MNRLLIRLAMTATAVTLLSSNPIAAQLAPTTKKAARVRILKAPEPERADDYLTIIRWTTNNPGGTPEHFGVVHYGTHPKDLSKIAKNPIQLNPSHPQSTFRVRIEGLKPGTTYYYTVESTDSAGNSEGVKSPVTKFTTSPVSQFATRSAK